MKVIELYKEYVQGESDACLFPSDELYMAVYRKYCDEIDLELMALYGEREFYNPFENLDIFLYWQSCWKAFSKRNAHTFNRMWEDINKDYDFDVLFKRDVIRTTDYYGGENETSNYGQASSDTVHGEVPNDSSSGNYKDVDKTTVTDRARENHSSRNFQDRQDKEIETTRGNTGVYTETDLLEREYKFRVKNDFFIDIFSKFLAEVCYYV